VSVLFKLTPEGPEWGQKVPHGGKLKGFVHEPRGRGIGGSNKVGGGETALNPPPHLGIGGGAGGQRKKPLLLRKTRGKGITFAGAKNYGVLHTNESASGVKKRRRPERICLFKRTTRAGGGKKKNEKGKERSHHENVRRRAREWGDGLTIRKPSAKGPGRQGGKGKGGSQSEEQNPRLAAFGGLWGEKRGGTRRLGVPLEVRKKA